MDPKTKHLPLHEAERKRIIERIEEDYRTDNEAHQTRLRRWREYYRRWRTRFEQAAEPGDEAESNYVVPMIEWFTFLRWSQFLQSLFGEDAEIVAKPIGPSDHRHTQKVGVFMSWRVFQYMDALLDFAVWSFRTILFGRAFVYRPWRRRQLPSGEVLYDAPVLEPCWPSEVIVPPEDVQTIHQFSHVMRRIWVTPQDLLDGEAEGRYYGVEANFQQILDAARGKSKRDATEDIHGDQQIENEKDDAEGVMYTAPKEGSEGLWLIEWYGRWRLPRRMKDGEAGVYNMKRREHNQTDLVVSYLPALQMDIGILRLNDIYPDARNPRPFDEMALVMDGSYWCKGFGEMLIDEEDEESDTWRLVDLAMKFGIGPAIFYDPASGYDPQQQRYEPFTSIPVAQPEKVNPVLVRTDISAAIAKSQYTVAVGERSTGLSDQNAGRAIDRPNAPRTAAGQIALIEQGNIRAFLDNLFMRLWIRRLLNNLWDMERSLGDERVWFRVVEDDSKGLIATKGGGAELTREEKRSRYDFDIQFASTVWSREARKQEQIALYQADLANPIIATNPRALWAITNRLHAAMGDPNFSDVVPQPPDPGMPKPPKEEWTLMLQGETVDVHPQDNDDLHLVDHYRRAGDATSDPNADRAALTMMAAHIADHQRQKRTKMLMQAMAEKVAEGLATTFADPSAGGLDVGPSTVPMAHLGQTIAELTGAGGNGETDAGRNPSPRNNGKPNGKPR